MALMWRDRCRWASRICLASFALALATTLLCGSTGLTQETTQPDRSEMTRDQWRAEVDAARRRLDQMRREHRSLLPPTKSPAEKDADTARRAFEDDSLQAGDIVSTGQGLFQFKGGSSAPHSRDDFVPLGPARDQQPR